MKTGIYINCRELIELERLEGDRRKNLKDITMRIFIKGVQHTARTPEEAQHMLALSHGAPEIEGAQYTIDGDGQIEIDDDRWEFWKGVIDEKIQCVKPKKTKQEILQENKP